MHTNMQHRKETATAVRTLNFQDQSLQNHMKSSQLNIVEGLSADRWCHPLKPVTESSNRTKRKEKGRASFKARPLDVGLMAAK